MDAAIPSLDQLQKQIVEVYDGLAQRMRTKGFAKRIGFGSRPAVVVIDLIKGFTDPNAPMGSVDFDNAVAGTRKVLDGARQVGIPVFLVTSAYDQALLEAGAWELKVDHDGIFHGSHWIEFDPRLGQLPTDQVVVKKYPSCFFGTDLASRMVAQQVDTVIVTGASTSGCVRATAVDACCSGFRTIVVEDAVGDRFLLPHRSNLFDIEMKYGDVVTIAETLAYLKTIDRPRISAKGTKW
jgi:maleamate amidohydrolase